jgi:hypothetical protein
MKRREFITLVGSRGRRLAGSFEALRFDPRSPELP